MNKKIRITQIDGKLPNIALMRLSAWHISNGDEIYFTKQVEREMFEPDFDVVYGSAIFSQSSYRVELFKEAFPDAIIGGTWKEGGPSVDEITGDFSKYDYSIYPQFDASIGFTQRGCRLKCGFCVVPRKEGKNHSVASIQDIWRGDPYPRHLHLLDNDFFGQANDQWDARLREILDGKFKVCLNQGINIRLITEDQANRYALVPYYDDSFKVRRLYTAWDNLKDEGVFMRAVERLQKAGIPPTHLMVYMLVGYDPKETWERLLYRFNKMVALGIRPYPMVYNADRKKTLPLGGHNSDISMRTLGEFQRWVIRKSYTFVPFEEYDVNAKGHKAGDDGTGYLFT